MTRDEDDQGFTEMKDPVQKNKLTEYLFLVLQWLKS